MVLSKKYWILIGLIVLVGGTLVYFGWTREKPGPIDLQSEQTKQESESITSQPEEIRPEPMSRIMIPSSLGPENIIVEFARYIRVFGEMITREDSFWTDSFEITYPSEGFLGGTIGLWQGKGNYYVKKDGTKIEGPDDLLSFIVAFAVLKYEKPESAQKDYDRIAVKQEFKDFSLEGIELKTKIGLPPVLESDIQKMPEIKLKPEQCQQYLLYSNNFIIYAFGLKEAAEDLIIRVIDQYGVK